MTGNDNNWGFVKGTLNNSLDLALPIFAGRPEQNAKAHLNALIEFIQIKNVPPPLHLAVARRSMNGISVTTWADAIWDQLETFDDFQDAFLGKFWSPQCQAKVRLEIYQDRYDPRGGLSYGDHLLKYAVKAKYLEPSMSNFEFLNALKEHYPVSIRKAWIVAKPRNLQDAAAFLTDVMSLEENPETLEPRRPVYQGQRDNYNRQRSDPRDDRRGSWNRNQRHAGSYESGPDERHAYRNQEWQGRGSYRGETRNHDPDRDGGRRNQAAAAPTPSYGTETRDRQDRREENIN
ncbi:hypothetical protein B7P43_G07480 [Cryptotermes secundus]|uniref:Retrotransposon gag domain-containing protein n=1 Tax=Cryptotermes secundus TaxID=105785 RepID=A0A2J7PHW2_9NEOP|nr:hypothetical protein B7P43_G07480 [Cryptotermes secundus]